MCFKLNIYSVVFLALLPFLEQSLGLVTVPVPDDLLGPGKCPTGSFCIDTDHCTQEYYTTKSGMPFYCGPHQNIDSMICCLSIEPGASFQDSVKATPAPTPGNGLNSDDDFGMDLKRAHRSHPNLTSNLGESSDDDEVVILSMPFLANNELPGEQFEVPLPNSNELEGQFDTLNDLDSLVEGAIEQELNEKISSEEEDTRFRFYPTKFNFQTRNTQWSRSAGDDADDIVHDASEEQAGRNLEERANSNRYSYQVSPACACEKGEKGEPGSKGEPGEPGKVIYIPVFVNSESGVPSQYGPGGPFDGSMFGASQQWPFNAPGNQKQYRPSRENSPPQQSQSKTPTVITYPVPVQGLPSMSLTPPEHKQQPARPKQPKLQTPSPPHPQSNKTPIPPPAKPPTPPLSPLSTAHPDDLVDRLVRHASEHKRNGRQPRAN